MRINISTSITDIDPAAWDALDHGGSPFLRHAFLSALETTGCIGRRTGWQSAPITLFDERGLAAEAPAGESLLAASPLNSGPQMSVPGWKAEVAV